MVMAGVVGVMLVGGDDRCGDVFFSDDGGCVVDGGDGSLGHGVDDGGGGSRCGDTLWQPRRCNGCYQVLVRLSRARLL